MNYLKTDLPGGMYLEGEDLLFNQNGIKEAIKGIASIAGSNCWLSGIAPLNTVGGTNLTYTEGFVFIEGEVYRVPAASVPLNGNFYYFEVEESYDPDGLEYFEDGGSPKNTYVVRTVKIVTYASAQTETAVRKSLFNTPTFNQVILNLMSSSSNEFQKMQSWKQGNDSVINAGANVVALNDYLSGNSFNVDITNATVALKRFSVKPQNGTWYALRFIGSGTLTISDGTALSNGIDTRNSDYIFAPGDVAVFVWMNDKARLVSGGHKLWFEAAPSLSATTLVSVISNVNFRWQILGKTVHCRYNYQATATGAGDMFVTFTMPNGITAQQPHAEGVFVAYMPNGDYPVFGACRIGNFADYTKMVHLLRNVPQSGVVTIRGVITFEIQ